MVPVGNLREKTIYRVHEPPQNEGGPWSNSIKWS